MVVNFYCLSRYTTSSRAFLLAFTYMLAALMTGCSGGGGSESASNDGVSAPPIIQEPSVDPMPETPPPAPPIDPPIEPPGELPPPEEPPSEVIPVAQVRGVFATTVNNQVGSHPQVQGALVRVEWAAIEPAAGAFDFTAIDEQLEETGADGKSWSLAVLGGSFAPFWLYGSPYDVPPLFLVFRQDPVQAPKFWDEVLQERLALLAQALAERYGQDANLRLVYLPQMSLNGVEGHFNGNFDNALIAQGFSEDLWVEAVLQAARAFAAAFPDKPIAVELHYVLGSSSAGERIMEAIETDSALLRQVGVAMWWLSGKTDYQPDLLAAFTDFEGAIYGQPIDKSDDTDAFLDGDFSTVFAQAKALKIKYLEVWEEDITSLLWDELLEDFNTYAQE